MPQTRPRARRAANRRGRLAGKVALITGAGGNLGAAIVRRYLEEGADVVLAGRSHARLETALRRAQRGPGRVAGRAFVLPFDAADPGQARRAIEHVLARAGRLDVLVNNAGSTGPKQPLERVPLTRADLEALRAQGSADTETVRDAAGNLFGLAWQVVRAAAAHLRPGASIVNVSTIFSRTRYFGRSAYVVPKAALNAFSQQLARQLGPCGIRVNVVYPGPIDGARIESAFAAMDALRRAPSGTTADDFLATMALARADAHGAAGRAFPTLEDVADTVVFLGSDESRAYAAHGFEVTNGMSVPQEPGAAFTSRPELRTLSADGETVLVAAGDQLADALAIARVQAACGAHVLLGLGSEEGLHAAHAALTCAEREGGIEPVLCDRGQHEPLAAALAAARARSQRHGPHGPLRGAIVLPAHGPARFRAPLVEASDTDVDDFLSDELCGAIRVARELTRFWAGHAPRGSAPRAVFVSNGDDGRGNVYAGILQAAIEQLIRIWRDESEVAVHAGERPALEWPSQILRFGNAEEESLPFAAGHAAGLLYARRRPPQISLHVSPGIGAATGSRRSLPGSIESLPGLHLGKCALITGGSAGIGGQLARLLAIAGARVMIAARRASELERHRDAIVRELGDIGYGDPQERVRCLADVDVGDEAALDRALAATLAAFGRVDYLVNNAGVAGAERMAVDMEPAEWRATLRANLVSNYSLIEKVVPLMKAQGSGYILNVSSSFGGEQYVAVPYPNRSDYAVSKAGQRALVENLARFVGPEIQINAIAPGPVDGRRLHGSDGRAGLFERRAQLILESRRLAGLHGAVLEAVADGSSVLHVLDALAANDAGLLAQSTSAPEPLRSYARRIAAEAAVDAEPAHSSLRFLMTRALALQLVARLQGGCLLLEDAQLEWASRWAQALPEPPPPFLDPAAVAAEADRIRTGVLGMLHLHRMPTETDVALATVFFMADRAISGDTFAPSGGLALPRTITERELSGRAEPERVRRMERETVWIIGEHLVEPLAAAATLLLAEGHIAGVTVLTKTAPAGEAIRRAIGAAPGRERVSYLVVGDDLEHGIDRAYRAGGRPAAVVSSPFGPLPDVLFGAAPGEHLDAAGFDRLVEDNLTHHFRVARRASLYAGTRLILVSPDVPAGGTLAQFALANFVKTTLHAFTATLAVENERLPAAVPVNQVNLTRRMRGEEPRNAAEQAEEYARFAHAVLLAAAPPAEPPQSRYPARIDRGLAITV